MEVHRLPMVADSPLRLGITGAGGFVGQALVRALAAQFEIIATDRDGLAFDDLPNVISIAGDLGDAELISSVSEKPLDAFIHLATVPGGAAELQPALGSQVNVAASMAIIDAVARHGNCPRLLFASSIAVFGDPLPSEVDDETHARPMLRYGAHKAMLEEWIATLTRRGEVRGLSLRLPGIVARPLGPSGMKSAFLSNLFHHLKAHDEIVLPVSPEATCWLLSRSSLIGQIAAAIRVPTDPNSARLNLPAMHVRMRDLVAEIACQTDSDIDLVRYDPDPAIEAAFGSQPPLFTPRAEALGLRHDGNLPELVRNVLYDI